MKRLTALWQRLTNSWQRSRLPDYHQYPVGGPPVKTPAERLKEGTAGPTV